MRKILNEKTLNEALVSMIVTQNLPFRFIESPFFRAFCSELNPEAQSLISSHSTLKLRISNSWSLHKDILRKKLQSSLSTIHLALDVWTSPNQKLFLGICAQFVDFETEQLAKALIALPSIPSHHSEVQHNILFKSLQDFGIYHKVGAFIGDNATSNDKLCLLLDSKFEEEGIHWKASENRIRCTGHIINLAVQSFLFQKHEEEKDFEPGFFRNIGPLGKLHNIGIHIRGSISRTDQFKTLAGRNIPLDNSTRWNSWYEMLRVALEKEMALDTYLKTWYQDLKSDFLSPQDWGTLRSIQSFLKPFYSATKTTEGDHATIDRVLLVMDALVQHYKKSQETFKSDSFLSHRIQKSWQTFDKYYAKTEDTPYYAAAILFHPSRKTEYLMYNWEKKWVKPTVQAVKTLGSTSRKQEIKSRLVFQRRGASNTGILTRATI